MSSIIIILDLPIGGLTTPFLFFCASIFVSIIYKKFDIGRLWCIVVLVIKYPPFKVDVKYFKRVVRLLPIGPTKRTDCWYIDNFLNNCDWQIRLDVGTILFDFNSSLFHCFHSFPSK